MPVIARNAADTAAQLPDRGLPVPSLHPVASTAPSEDPMTAPHPNLSAPSPKIHAAMAAILKQVKAITKDRQNTGQGFKFRGIDDVMNELHEHMANNGVYVRPHLLKATVTERATKSGAVQLHTVVRVRVYFVADDGSETFIVVPGEAADSGDKSVGKAMSYALKTGCLQVFMIPTEEEKDPDAQSTTWAGRNDGGNRRTPPKADNRAPPAADTTTPNREVSAALRPASLYIGADNQKKALAGWAKAVAPKIDKPALADIAKKCFDDKATMAQVETFTKAEAQRWANEHKA